MSNENGKRVYAYNTEEGFDRAARAVRYVERLRHGLTDPQPQDQRPVQQTAALVRTRYTGGIVVPSDDPDKLYPVEVMGYDDETGSWRVITDPAGDPVVGLASGMNDEGLEWPDPSDTSKKATVYVAHAVGYYHWVDDPELCDPSYEKFQGGPLFRVAVGGGVNRGVVVRKNSSGLGVGPRPRLNFIEGTGVTLTVADDVTDEEVDVTIASSAGGGTYGWFVRGVLDGALSYQGSATMSVWAWDGSAEADSTADVTVYDWTLSSGQSIAAGKRVSACWDFASNRYYVVQAQCP